VMELCGGSVAPHSGGGGGSAGGGHPTEQPHVPAGAKNGTFCAIYV
jgi:hypothetical protein